MQLQSQTITDNIIPASVQSNQELIPTIKVTEINFKKIDDFETKQAKDKAVRLGRRLFFTNFLFASLILLYLTVFYALLVDLQFNISDPVYQEKRILYTFGSADFLMVIQHMASFFIIINHSRIGLIVCIVLHFLSIVLKILGSIFFIYLMAQRIKVYIVIFPIIVSMFQITIVFTYLMLLQYWKVMPPHKWKKKFTLVRKPLNQKFISLRLPIIDKNMV